MVERSLSMREVLGLIPSTSTKLSFDFSLESGCFVDEEPYELVDFSLAVKTMRLDREAFQKDFR